MVGGWLNTRVNEFWWTSARGAAGQTKHTKDLGDKPFHVSAINLFLELVRGDEDALGDRGP